MVTYGTPSRLSRRQNQRERWPEIEDGVMRLTAAQLSVLIEGLD